MHPFNMKHTGPLEELTAFQQSLSVFGLSYHSVIEAMERTGAVIAGEVAVDQFLYMMHKTHSRPKTIEFRVYGGIAAPVRPVANDDEEERAIEDYMHQELIYHNAYETFNTLARFAGYTYDNIHETYNNRRIVTWKCRNLTLQLAFSTTPIATQMRRADIGLAAGYIYKPRFEALSYRHFKPEDVVQKRLAWTNACEYRSTERITAYAQCFNIIPDAYITYNFSVSDFIKNYDTLSERGRLYIVGTRSACNEPAVQRRIRGIPQMTVQYVYTDEPAAAIPGLEWGGEPVSSSQSTIMYESD